MSLPHKLLQYNIKIKYKRYLSSENLINKSNITKIGKNEPVKLR